MIGNSLQALTQSVFVEGSGALLNRIPFPYSRPSVSVCDHVVGRSNSLQVAIPARTLVLDDSVAPGMRTLETDSQGMKESVLTEIRRIIQINPDLA